MTTNNCCSHCSRSSGSLKRCTGCGVAQFCNVTCQRNAWRQHKPFCLRTEGNTRFKSGQFEEAGAKYEAGAIAARKLIDRGEGDAATEELLVVLHSNHAQCLLNTRQWKSAKVAAEAALALEPAHEKSQLRLTEAVNGLQAEEKAAAETEYTFNGRKLPKYQRKHLMCAACDLRVAAPELECEECHDACFCSPACQSHGHSGCEVVDTGARDVVRGMSVDEMQQYLREVESNLGNVGRSEICEYEALVEDVMTTIPRERESPPGRPSVEHIKALAKQGHPGAAFMHALARSHGMGMDGTPIVPGSSRQEAEMAAVEWHRVAAKQGCLPAMTTLADMLADGKGCRQDIRQACDLWFEAGQRGVQYAKLRVLTRHELHLSLEVRAFTEAIESVGQMVASGQLPRTTTGPISIKKFGGPNLGALLLSASPGWCRAESSPLLRRRLLEFFRASELTNVRVNPCYGRRGAMAKATEGVASSRTRREAANLEFVLGSQPRLCDTPTADATAAFDERERRAVLMARTHSIGFTVACVHSNRDDADSSHCRACRAAALSRLWASTRALYATSETEPFESKGRHVIYKTESGEIRSETFKDYCKAEILAVLSGLAAAVTSSEGGGARPVAHPLFMAQDPNLFWPVVSYFGSVREGLLAVKPDGLDDDVWLCRRLGLGEMPPLPETDTAERGQFSLDEAGAARNMCGAEDCNSFCATPPSRHYCSKCRIRAYCSEDCQHRDWSRHKLECRHKEYDATKDKRKGKKGKKGKKGSRR